MGKMNEFSQAIDELRRCGDALIGVADSLRERFSDNSTEVEATSRDILCYAMKTLRCCNIVAHIHDEVVIDADKRMSLEAVCEQMGRTPPWAPGLKLRADGFECNFYKKD